MAIYTSLIYRKERALIKPKAVSGAGLILLLLGILGFTFGVQSECASDGTDDEPLVYILVNASIYDSVDFHIERYVSDVEKTGFKTNVLSVNLSSPQDVRNILASAYSEGLVGCLLVGDVPWAMYEIDSQWGHEEFPIDLFYMDLDGVWNSTDGDDMYDQHTGDRAPEIWVGRIKASDMAEDEVSLIQNYFDKNHCYRTGNLSLPDRALVYIDDDWVLSRAEIDDAVGLVFENRTVIYDKVTTQREDYLDRLKQNWSLVNLWAHSDYWTHWFHVNDNETYVYFSDIRSVDPHAFFYVLYSCSSAKYTKPDYLAGWYVLGKTYGLAVVGMTKTGGMWENQDFYSNFKNETLGFSFRKWFKNRVADEDENPSIWYDKSWYYGMTILGDPTLRVRDTAPPNITEISQTPHDTNVLPEDEVKINATVTDDLSGVNQVTLNYTNGNGTWITVNMTNSEGNVWNATIPRFPTGTSVKYVIGAKDNTNKTITTKEMGCEYQYHVIPEFTSISILPLFIISTILAVTYYRKKHSKQTIMRYSPSISSFPKTSVGFLMFRSSLK